MAPNALSYREVRLRWIVAVAWLFLVAGTVVVTVMEVPMKRHTGLFCLGCALLALPCCAGLQSKSLLVRLLAAASLIPAAFIAIMAFFSSRGL